MTMRDLSQDSHHPAVEEISQVLSDRCNNKDFPFFRLIVAYYLSNMASTMRAEIDAPAFSRDPLPINAYMVMMANSGVGKGKSLRIMKNEVCQGFFDVFDEYTMPTLAEKNITAIGSKTAAIKSTNQDDEVQKLMKEYEDLGPYLMTFDDVTVPALKDMRHKVLLANVGALNLQVDEMGMNLLKVRDGLAAYLELYDVGHIEEKLTKNSADNKRKKPLKGCSPANMLLFGAPSMIFDAGQIQALFNSLLSTGYARRCFFAYGQLVRDNEKDPLDIEYDKLTEATSSPVLDKWADHFANLATASCHQWLIDMPKSVGLELLAYKRHCEELADAMPEEQEIRKAEMAHRFFKTLKLAGTFAFIDQASTMTEQHLYAAMKITEESGEAFHKVMNQDADYMKLARFIANHAGELTHPDIAQALPFYSPTGPRRKELLTFATAWGHKNHIIIQKSFRDNIDFITGETLQETDLSKMVVSHSPYQADEYQQEEAPFDQLHNLTQMPSPHNFTTHWFKGGHRHEDNRIPGFNLLVCDIDGTADINLTSELFDDHIHMIYTTKSHKPDPNKHRFRLIFPMNYVLKLDQEDYRQFMENFMTWLPFQIDQEAAIDTVRKWATNDGQYHYNLNGKLLDVLPFIPKTSRNEDYITMRDKTLKDLDALERFFAQRMQEGMRNKNMLKFALALVDDGMSYLEVEKRVLAFNKKLSNALTVDELKRTVLTTAAKKATAAHP